jgi:hypothetical protein
MQSNAARFNRCCALGNQIPKASSWLYGEVIVVDPPCRPILQRISFYHVIHTNEQLNLFYPRTFNLH